MKIWLSKGYTFLKIIRVDSKGEQQHKQWYQKISTPVEDIENLRNCEWETQDVEKSIEYFILRQVQRKEDNKKYYTSNIKIIKKKEAILIRRRWRGESVEPDKGVWMYYKKRS